MHPLGAGLLPPFAVAPDGSALLLLGDVRASGPRGSFEVLKLSLEGDTILRRDVEYVPRRIGPAEREQIHQAFAEYVEDPRLPRSALDFPEAYPPVRQLVAGNDGSLWLLRELDLTGGEDRWEVEGFVRITGVPSCPLPWEPRMTILRATWEEIWGTSRDDLGVPYIHRFRVDRRCP